MNEKLLLTIIAVFLPIFIESLFLILQLKGRKLTNLFGKKAFFIHASVTGFLWVLAFLMIFILQFEKQPLFHNSVFLKYSGAFLLCLGMILSIAGFLQLGLKRALCVNFFEDNVPNVSSALYNYIKNPIDFGFWAALTGFALFTESTYNLIIGIEFIAIMIPHTMLENIPLQPQKKPAGI